MLSLVTLFIMSLSFGGIVFEIIDKFSPDIAKYGGSSLKSSMSGILIASPIFYFSMNAIYSSLKTGELNKDSEVRKWLVYFILFISSVVVIGALMGILNTFLDGALTINFIFKALTVLFIACLIFGFYFYDIKRQEFTDFKVNKVFFLVSLIFVLSGLIASFFIVESPTEARNRKIDDMILQDFNNIDYALQEYYNKNEELPETLNNLKDSIRYFSLNFVNPVNNEEYVYEIVGEKKYRLCTYFSSSNILKERKSYLDERWEHSQGYNCIEINIYYE